MMRLGRFGAGMLWVLLLLILPIPVSCRAEAVLEEQLDTVFVDESSDQTAYGQWVAMLNHDTQPEPDEMQAAVRESALYAVLTRTDGRQIDFSVWSPRYVVAGPSRCYTLFFDGEAAADQASAELSALPGILYAERDGTVSACEEEQTSFYSWGAARMNFGPYLSLSNQRGSGSVTVAVIDSGVYLHPQLISRIPESGFDYVDADFDATNDAFGHGTNVAGILADCTMNAPVYFYPIRVLNAGGGGKISNVVNGLREATEKRVDLINLSLVSEVMSEAMDQAILDAVDAGITVVIAAGNKAVDTSQVCPAHLQNSGVIVVGAAEADGSRASYSNFGTSVDVYAYGSNIICCSRSGGYTTATGTSMAAPHITALSSLMRLLHPGIGPSEIESRIRLAVDDAKPVALPDLLLLVPERLGFSLTLLRMDPAQTIQMPSMAIPMSSLEKISYSSSDETILKISDGCLIPQRQGTVIVTVKCLGFEESSFDVQITQDAGETLRLPQGVTSVEDEAFLGDSALTRVVLPEGIELIGSFVFEDCTNLISIELPGTLLAIGENTFSGAVLFCEAESAAETYALENDISYVSKSLP